MVYLFSVKWLNLNNNDKIDLAAMTEDGFWIYYNTLTPETSVKNEPQINNFYVYQNYPNPFNPNTIIKYSIPKTSHVELKIFEVLGRKVATLINEEKTAGTYIVEFSAKDGSASGGNTQQTTNNYQAEFISIDCQQGIISKQKR